MRPAGRQVAGSVSLSAPVGGWNARDSLADMQPTDAVILENLFPATTYVQTRLGYTQYSTGLGSQVETVMAYAGLSTNKLLAAAGSSIYEVTSGGAVGAAIKTGLSNARFQFNNYANTGGNYLYMVNGQDSPMYWDGTTFTDAAITGVTKANLIHVNQHKSRLWFVEKNTLNAWYLAPSAIAGAATRFDLTGIAMEGGSLMAMATWTIDAGYGVDDIAVFITTKGEVILYRGTDPSSASTWALVGVFLIGTPIGRRCFVKFAGDLLLITQDGVYPMSGALQSSRTNPKVALTDKIQFAVSASVSLYGSNFGWQLIAFPKENMLFLNVPFTEGADQQQYVMNTISKSWCNFSGWDANCWEVFNDDIYFGGNGFVGKAWSGLNDNGNNINTNGLQAFSYLGSPGEIKRVTMMRPILRSDGSPTITANVNVDFDVSDTTGTLSFTPTSYGVWDSSLWDVGVWGAGLSILKNWQGANGLGYAIAPHLQSAQQGIQMQWMSTDIVFERGDIL